MHIELHSFVVLISLVGLNYLYVTFHFPVSQQISFVWWHSRCASATEIFCDVLWLSIHGETLMLTWHVSRTTMGAAARNEETVAGSGGRRSRECGDGWARCKKYWSDGSTAVRIRIGIAQSNRWRDPKPTKGCWLQRGATSLPTIDPGPS